MSSLLHIVKPPATVVLPAVERHPLVARLVDGHEFGAARLLYGRGVEVRAAVGREENEAPEERPVARPI